MTRKSRPAACWHAYTVPRHRLPRGLALVAFDDRLEGPLTSELVAAAAAARLVDPDAEPVSARRQLADVRCGILELPGTAPGAAVVFVPRGTAQPALVVSRVELPWLRPVLTARQEIPA